MTGTGETEIEIGTGIDAGNFAVTKKHDTRWKGSQCHNSIVVRLGVILS